jgi:hypothetical protein
MTGISPRSGRKNKLVTERGRDRAAGFEQGLQMGFGSFLKPKDGFTTIFALGMAAGQQSGFRNPHTVFILSHLNPRDWNDHRNQ